jgi:magnesium-transporting ATPase (P-type)
MSVWRAIIAAWSSRKLWMFVFTVLILWAGLERIIGHIYSMPVEKIPHMVALATIVFGGIVCAAGAYMGFQTWQARFSADSVASALSETKVTVNKFEGLTREFAEKYRDDPSYRPIRPEDA